MPLAENPPKWSHYGGRRQCWSLLLNDDVPYLVPAGSRRLTIDTGQVTAAEESTRRQVAARRTG